MIPPSACPWPTPAGRRTPTLCCLTTFVLIAASSLQAQTPPELITYNFSVIEAKTLPGGSATPGAPCNGTLAAADTIQNLALAAVFYQNACYTDGRFNHRDFLVERGAVTATGGAVTLAAYRIHEPQTKATQFLASKHAIYYRFPTIENYSVYSFAGGAFSKVADIPAGAIPNTNTFVPVPTGAPITVSDVAGSVTYVFAPSSIRVSSYTVLAPGVEGAKIASTPFGDVLKYRYTVAGTPFDTATDFSAGPGAFDNTYSDTRRFYVVRNSGNSALGAVWQDQLNSALKLTWFGADRKSPTTVTLANPLNQKLACATGDDNGNVYFLTVQPGSGAPNSPRSVMLTKASATGTTLAAAAVDASAAGLNLVEFFRVASMKHLNGKVAVMIGRTMLQSGDGLNHQGGIAVVFNGATLAIDRNWGQTSSHSWENVLTTNANNEFIGLDLGDNFPRGIHLHKFNSTTKNSRVISSYKTAHGTTPQSTSGASYPVYTEISGGGTTYYRWSNDNGTYTELGGLAQTSLGYAASFVGERSPGGRLIDNSRVGNGLNDPRNVGFITVIENFQTATGSGSEVSDDLVVTRGLVETAGFYSFTGGWTPQRNAGVVWLSNYTSPTQNASRLKMTSRADGSLLLLWELWNADRYLATKGLTVAANGTILNAETDLTTQVRLGRRDDPVRVSNSTYLVSGSKADTTLELIVIEPSTSPPTPTATTLAATSVSGAAATLNGSANPNGLAAFGFFQWGATTGYGQNTTPVNVGNGTGAVPFSTPIAGLAAGQTYHFRAAVSNSTGIVYGSDLTFATPGAASVVIVQSPTNTAACAGSSVTFSVTATGATGYQWQRRAPGAVSFINLAGAITATFSTPPVTAADDGATYRVIATAPGTNATSAEASLTVIAATAPTVTYNFNSGLPAGTAIYGNAYVDAPTGVLELNPNLGSQNGAFLTPDLAPGRTIAGFTATFRARVQQGSSPPADGFSFNWATDLPAGTYPVAEEGAGSGLRVAFDTWDNGGAEAPAIDVWWNTNLVARRSVSVPFLVRGAGFFDVRLRLTTNGLFDLSYACETIFSRLPIPGFAPQTGARFGLGARTGGAWETHGIDDLAIELYTRNANALTITRSGNNATIDWPASIRGVLQHSPGLAPTAWTYTPSGAAHPVIVPATTPAAFYRLVLSPANDDFAGRTLLSGTSVNVSASNAGATKEAGERNHAANPGGRSLWWSWTAPTSGTVTIGTTGLTLDTVLAVYTGNALNSLNEVAANDDFDGNLFSRVSFPATQNVTYQIAVDGYNNNGTGAATGTVQLSLTLAP